MYLDGSKKTNTDAYFFFCLQISRWMYHAEAIKKYIEVKDLHPTDTSEAEEKDTEKFYKNISSKFTSWTIPSIMHYTFLIEKYLA